MRISFHPDATAELEASAGWYAKRNTEASRSFCVAVDIAIANVESDPERFARIDARHRACSVRKFPFQIVFRHDNDQIVVVAVAHAKRRPGYWRER